MTVTEPPTTTVVAPRTTASKSVWLVAALAAGVEILLSARYGYVRDELYFLAAGAHPSYGYVDQPALTPLLAHLDALVTGNTLIGLRALPALLFAGLVLLTASMARQLGASSRGQLIAAIATACCAEYLGAFHEWTTTVPDFFGWAVLLLLLIKLLKSGNPRWWLAVGTAGGIAMSFKWNIGFLVAGVLLGFCCTPAARPLLPSRYLAAGALLFIVLASPDFIWQAQHGWANLTVFASLQGESGANRIMYWPGQVLYTSILLVPLWIAGLRWALRSPLLRVLGVAAAFVIVIQFVLGGKTYYPGGIYTFLFAAGAVSLGSLSWRSLRLRSALYGLAAVVSAFISLPVLPAAALATFPAQKVNYDLGEEIGWPSEVKLLAGVWHNLPATERVRATVVTANYGEAGAVERYGASFGLPQAYCGGNSFWYWGPPPAGDTDAVVIGIPASFLRQEFAHVTQVAVYRNGLNVSDDEEDTPVYVVTGLRTSWASTWPAFRHFD